MLDHFLSSAKAYAAAIGAGLTAVIALNPQHAPQWAVIVCAACTGIATATIPEKQVPTSADSSPYVPDLVTSADPPVVDDTAAAADAVA